MNETPYTNATYRGKNTSPPRPASRAFTLIELLMVMAILVILTLIAIPNFLEAQTRGKIARAQVDLRTLAMALEAYRGDQGAYPQATTFCASQMDSIAAYNQTPEALATPIAYLSAIPMDVFNPEQAYKYITPGLGWANGSATILAIWVPENFPNEADDARDIPYFSQQTAPIAWGLWSVGPSGPLTVFESDMLHIPVPRRTWYNPTNGTLSEGVVPRLSDGHTAP